MLPNKSRILLNNINMLPNKIRRIHNKIKLLQNKFRMHPNKIRMLLWLRQTMDDDLRNCLLLPLHLSKTILKMKIRSQHTRYKAWSRQGVAIYVSCNFYFLILLYLYISCLYCQYKLLYLRPSYHLLAAL